MAASEKEKLTKMIKSGNLNGAYLLYGEEQFLVSRYGRNIRKTVVPAFEEMNVSRFYGKFQDTEKAVSEILDVAQTMPFLSEKRVIEISNSGFFKTRSSKKASSDDEEDKETPVDTGSSGKIAKLVSSLPDTCVIIFEETEIDKRSSLYKQIKKVGCVVEFPVMKGEKQRDAVLKEARRMGLEIDSNALVELISYTGADLWAVVKELEKLKCYCWETNKVTLQDVKAICIRNPEDRIFEMVDDISSGKKKHAMMIYRDLLALGKNTFNILSLIARDYNLLLSARDGLDRGLTEEQIKPLVKCDPRVTWLYIKKANAFTRSSLIRGLEMCAKAQQDITTGKLPDRIALELFIAES